MNAFLGTLLYWLVAYAAGAIIVLLLFLVGGVAVAEVRDWWRERRRS